MTWTQLKVWAYGLAALGLTVGGGAVASQKAQVHSTLEAGVKPGALPLKVNNPVPPKEDRDAEVEALKKEIEALRKKIEALDKKPKLPNPVDQKIVVTSALAKDIVINQQYVCQIRARRHIDVRALVPGILMEVLVKEGQAVKKGDVLFKGLPILYKAKFEAEMAEVRIAELELNNAKKLYDQKVISVQEVALNEAKYARAKAKAKLAEAELNFTEVRAPFDGLVGRLQEQEGSLVKQGDVLTTLSDNSVMWVYFNVPEARYLEYMADREQAKMGTPVELVLANGKKFPLTGILAAVEADFENETKNILYRADFPNPEGLLRYGQTGTVLIPRTLKNAIVIPQRAAFEVSGKRYVYVVGKDNVVHRREIVVQNETDGILVVKKGLDAGEKIVLEGVGQIHDDEKVEYEFRRPETVLPQRKIHDE